MTPSLDLVSCVRQDFVSLPGFLFSQKSNYFYGNTTTLYAQGKWQSHLLFF